MKICGWVVVAVVGGVGCGGLPALVKTSSSPGTSPEASDRGSARQSDAVIDDDIRSGLETAPVLGSDPPGFLVTWIAWDSGFRGTDLRIGDRVVAVNGERYAKPAKLEDLQRLLPKALGGHAEVQHWRERRARDGTEIELTVVRRAASGTGVETVKVRGKLRADRIYSTGMRRRIGPGGPDRLEGDGFAESWSGWYEKRAREWASVLDNSGTHHVNSRMMLASHLAEKARVDFLVKRYPGPFASAVQADWNAVRGALVGRSYQLTERDLAFRELGERRAGEIAAAGTKARDAFLSSVKADTIPAFPAVDPIRGDRTSVANKVVVLPEIGMRSWVSEGGRAYLAIGERGWYFVDLQKPEARRLLEAQLRYQKYVQPRLGETYAVIGRIKEEPMVIVVNGRAAAGLEVVPLGVTIGKAMFVDLTAIRSGVSPFAGEDALRVPTMPSLADSASPRAVMDAFFAALKLGEESSWRSLYATWWAEDWKEQGVIYHPFHEYKLEREWIRARRLVLDKVYGMAVTYVGAPRKVLEGTEFPKAPVIEEVLVEVEHVGKFDGQFHAFTDVDVHRVWQLQRRNGGPWRIAGSNGL